jgi:hypothetical protein
MQAEAQVLRSHDHENVRDIGQGEAKHTKYKGFNIGCGLAYGISNVYIAHLRQDCHNSKFDIFELLV